MRTQHEFNKLIALRHIYRSQTCKKRHLVASNLQKERIEPILRELRNQGLIYINRSTARITPFGKAYLKKADGIIPKSVGKKLRTNSKTIKLIKRYLTAGYMAIFHFFSMVLRKCKAFKLVNPIIKQPAPKLKESL